MASKYQTLSDFLLSPFNRKEDLTKDTEYATKYRQYVSKNQIRLVSTCEIEESFYLHVKIPSESNNGKYEYDVVIRFFTDKPEVAKAQHLRGYYIQFFSNSPSFMYQYAYLYNKEGYLIEALYNKLDADYIDSPPEKTNKNMVTSYDKSIYFACRFLSEKQFSYLEKHGIIKRKELTPQKFFAGISDFKSVKMDQVLLAEEKKLEKELDKKKGERKFFNKKTSEKSTSDKTKTTSVTYVMKKTGKKKVAKKVAQKTTFKGKK
jgi:hypothetical protein